MKKRGIALIAMVALLLTGVLAGCANDSNTESTGSNAGGNKGAEVTLTVSTRYSNDNPDEDFYRQKVQEFSDLDNGIKIEMDNLSTEADYLDKLRTSFANGDTPNVFIEYGGSRSLDYLEAGALLDLKPYLDENNGEWYNTFYESLWGQSIYEGYDGIYSVPFKSYMVALFYNKDLFEQVGVQPPETIDEMLTVSQAFVDAGILPFQAGEKDNYRFGHFNNNLIIKTLGVDAVDKLASRELSYDSPEMLATYQVMADMVAKGYFGKNILDTDAVQETEFFKAGQVAMKWDGSWFVANEVFGTEFYDHVGVMPFPYGDEANKDYAQGGSSDMFFVSQLNKSEEEIAASVEFVKYITSPEYFQELDEVAQTVMPVVFEKSANSPENPLLDDVIAIQAGLIDMRTDVQNYDPESHMLDTVRSSLQGLAMGDSPEQCAANIMGRIAEYSGQ